MSFRTIQHLWLVALLCLFVSGAVAAAQSETTPPRATLADPPAPLITATQEFKTKTEQVAKLQENEIATVLAKVDELRQLVAEGLVAKAELQKSEESLATLRRKLAATQQQAADAERMIAEIRAADELAKTQRVALKATQAAKSQGLIRPTSMRFSGSGGWSLTSLPVIQSFFFSKFGRVLPTSAIGQSAIHNQLGYDHRNAVDVALHPDSFEGQSLINYLRSQGIPFLAFRGPIPGVATGAHIHIGSPSHRLS